MARFTLWITTWKKHTMENWVTLELEWFAERQETKRVRKTLLCSHEVQSGPSCFLNSFSERSLGVAGSRLSLILDQLFMSKGLYMNVSLASIQHAIKITKAKSKLSYWRVMCDIGRLPKNCCWWKIPQPPGATLRGVPVQGEITGVQPRCLTGRAQRRFT